MASSPAGSAQMRAGDWVTLGSLVIAAFSLILGVRSVDLSAAQTEISATALEQSRQAEDLRFVGRVSVRVESPGGGIKVVNRGESAVLEIGLWSVGVTASRSNGNSLDTIKAELPGLSACTDLTVPMEEFRREARLTTSPYDAQRQADAESFGPPTDVAVDDVFVTLQAPSGRWYTVSEGGAIDDVSAGVEFAADEESHVEHPQLFRAMGGTEVLDVLGDTIAEGVDVERLFITEIEASANILEGVPRAVAAPSSNGCA